MWSPLPLGKIRIITKVLLFAQADEDENVKKLPSRDLSATRFFAVVLCRRKNGMYRQVAFLNRRRYIQMFGPMEESTVRRHARRTIPIQTHFRDERSHLQLRGSGWRCPQGHGPLTLRRNAKSSRQ